MEIEWFTVFAQIINFLVLVILLKKFLYTPVLNAMDQREAYIAQRLNEVEEKNRVAEQTYNSYMEKEKAFESNENKLMQEAKTAADEEKKKLISEAHSHVDQMKLAWQQTLKGEQQSFMLKLSQEVAQGVICITKQMLTGFSDQDLDNRLIKSFNQEVKNLSEERRDALIQAYKQSGRAVIRTGFDLNDTQRESVEQTLKKNLNNSISVHFEKHEALCLTVELEVDSRKVTWGLEGFSRNLKHTVMDLLEQEYRENMKESNSEKESLNHA